MCFQGLFILNPENRTKDQICFINFAVQYNFLCTKQDL